MRTASGCHLWARCRSAAGGLLLLLVSADPTLAATISGRVELPEPRPAPVVNRRYTVVVQGGVLSTDPPLAVVYLEGDFPPPAEPPPAGRILQRDLEFEPALLPVQVGTRVEFPNLDDTFHNVFSFSPARRFDLGRYRPDERPIPSVQFDEPGLVTVRCDIHEHMRALILVLPTPHFGVTDPDGNFRLEGLPAGRYMLKIWRDSRTTLEFPVELQDDTQLQMTIP